MATRTTIRRTAQTLIRRLITEEMTSPADRRRVLRNERMKLMVCVADKQLSNTAIAEQTNEASRVLAMWMPKRKKSKKKCQGYNGSPHEPCQNTRPIVTNHTKAMFAARVRGAEKRCADCGEPGYTTGHQECQYPKDH